MPSLSCHPIRAMVALKTKVTDHRAQRKSLRRTKEAEQCPAPPSPHTPPAVPPKSAMRKSSFLARSPVVNDQSGVRLRHTSSQCRICGPVHPALRVCDTDSCCLTSSDRDVTPMSQRTVVHRPMSASLCTSIDGYSLTGMEFPDDETGPANCLQTRRSSTSLKPATSAALPTTFSPSSLRSPSPSASLSREVSLSPDLLPLSLRTVDSLVALRRACSRLPPHKAGKPETAVLLSPLTGHASKPVQHASCSSNASLESQRTQMLEQTASLKRAKACLPARDLVKAAALERTSAGDIVHIGPDVVGDDTDPTTEAGPVSGSGDGIDTHKRTVARVLSRLSLLGHRASAVWPRHLHSDTAAVDQDSVTAPVAATAPVLPELPSSEGFVQRDGRLSWTEWLWERSVEEWLARVSAEAAAAVRTAAEAKSESQGESVRGNGVEGQDARVHKHVHVYVHGHGRIDSVQPGLAML